MAKIEVKYCEKCKEYQECTWVCDNEIAGEPLFSLMCCACGHTFDAEQPLLEPKELPKEQTRLFPQEMIQSNLSNCCFAPIQSNSDICSRCKEHCEEAECQSS